MSDICVKIRFKMFMYYRVRSTFEANFALLSNMICYFQDHFYLIKEDVLRDKEADYKRPSSLARATALMRLLTSNLLLMFLV